MTDQPIRIVRMITRLNISGPALHTLVLSSKFRDIEYETLLVCGDPLSATDTMDDVAKAYDIEPLIIPDIHSTMNPVKVLRGIWKIYRLLLDYQPHIVHTHARSAGVMGRIAARWAGVPVIVHTFHEYPFRGYFSPWKTRLFVFLERMVARVTDSIITLSESLRRAVADEYRIAPRSKIPVLPMGMDLTPFVTVPRHAGDFRQQWGIDRNDVLIGIVGRIIPVKNHALFLQVAKRVYETTANARFVIVGDGRLRAEIEAMTHALGLDDVVIFTGWQRDMPPVYSDLDVLVNSSTTEGTPVPIVEALVAGCPVVATDVGGIGDVLNKGEFGRLVPPDDVEALTQAILDVLDNPPDPAPAQQAMIARYGIDQVVTELQSLYRGLLAKKTKS